MFIKRPVRINRRALGKFTVFIALMAALTVAALVFAPDFIGKIKNPPEAREYLLSFGGWAYFVYTLIQAVHVVVVVIPGDVVTICGGYIYGLPLGFLLSFTGIMIGTVAAFYLSRFLGYDFINMFIAQEKIEKFSRILNSTGGIIGLLAVCLAPFVPKDIMIYVAGLTPIKPARLFLIYGLSRIPSTLTFTSVGAVAYEKSMMGIVVLITVLVVLAILGVVIRRYNRNKKTDDQGQNV